MDTITAVTLALGVIGVIVAWIVSYVLITNDNIAGPRTAKVAAGQAVASDEAAAPRERELVTSAS